MLLTTWLVAVLLASVAPQAPGAVGICPARVLDAVPYPVAAVVSPHDPFDAVPEFLILDEEEESEEDDWALRPDRFLLFASRASSTVLCSRRPFTPRPFLTSGAARSPPSV